MVEVERPKESSCGESGKLPANSTPTPFVKKGLIEVGETAAKTLLRLPATTTTIRDALVVYKTLLGTIIALVLQPTAWDFVECRGVPANAVWGALWSTGH